MGSISNGTFSRRLSCHPPVLFQSSRTPLPGHSARETLVAPCPPREDHRAPALIVLVSLTVKIFTMSFSACTHFPFESKRRDRHTGIDVECESQTTSKYDAMLCCPNGLSLPCVAAKRFTGLSISTRLWSMGPRADRWICTPFAPDWVQAPHRRYGTPIAARGSPLRSC